MSSPGEHPAKPIHEMSRLEFTLASYKGPMLAPRAQVDRPVFWRQVHVPIP